MKVPVLTYHSWLHEPSRYHNNDHIALAEDLQLIARLGLRIVTLENIVDALLMNRLHQLEGCVGVSFDDGFRLDVEEGVTASGEQCPSFLSILAEAAKEGFVHATSFVVGSGEGAFDPESGGPGHPDKQVTSSWLKADKSGLIKIENHGWRNEEQPSSCKESAARQINHSSDVIDSVLGKGYCRLYAYPHGRSHAYLVREYFPGFHAFHRTKAAFTTNPKPVTQEDNRWLLPRFVCQRDWHSPEELEALLRRERTVAR